MIDYHDDLREPAIVDLPDLSSDLVQRRFYASQMDQQELLAFRLKAPLFKYAQLSLNVQRERLSPTYDYQFQLPDLPALSDFQFSSVGLQLRYSYGEQFIPLLGSRVPAGNNPHPVFQLTYERGIEGFWGGQFDYDKWQFGAEHQFRIRGLGETSFRIEAGWINNTLPYSKLFAGSGLGRGFQLFAIDNNFQTMDLYEFVSDRFAHLFFTHNFGAFLYHEKYSRPEISVVQNIGYGQLNDRTPHQLIDFKTMEQGYFESGLVVDNLIRIPYVNFAYIGLGLGVYYRYGSYAFPERADNFAYRLSIDLTL